MGVLPDQGEGLFIHDLALHSDAAGTGQARAIIEQIATQAQGAGFHDLALVAVNDSVEFWRHQGFTVMAEPPALRAKFSTYGAGARYMSRPLMD